MAPDAAPSRWQYARPPLSRFPAAFSASCLIATLATDVAYWGTANMMWADFSAWLVTAGVVIGWFTVLVALIELLAGRSSRRRPNWAIAIAYVVALILATLDMLVHTRDAWTSVVPWGLLLSAATVLVLLVSGWMNRDTWDIRSAEVIT